MTSSVPYSSGPLDHVCISQALLASVDDGQTLDFSHKSICEINDEAIQELASIGRGDDDDEGCVTRCVLHPRVQSMVLIEMPFVPPAE